MRKERYKGCRREKEKAKITRKGMSEKKDIKLERERSKGRENKKNTEGQYECREIKRERNGGKHRQIRKRERKRDK